MPASGEVRVVVPGVGPSVLPASELPATGGNPTVPMFGLGLLALAAAFRRLCAGPS
ncbi:MAG: LPXTG cell wall anchor domain-containing protein [Acidimicrobiales bacterium]